MTSGKKIYVISNNDIIGKNSWIPRERRPGGGEEACDLLTPQLGEAYRKH